VYELTSFDLNNHFDDKMQMIEKYNPEKVYTVVYFEGKSKNYMVKRFMFENTVIGKQTSFISEEPGSKLILISGAAQPIAKVEQLKGKTMIPETAEMNLADLIDVKGMKAMGNRLSAHVVQSVVLITEHDDAADVPDPEPNTVEETEIVVSPEAKAVADTPPAKAVKPMVEAEETSAPIMEVKPEAEKPVSVEPPKTEPVKSEEKPVELPKVEPSKEPEPPAPKKIDFEITNPDDIEIDDKGQLGLF
jgi:topoisomerase-4 subunit A